MNGVCKGTFFLGPAPLGPWGGAKRSNIIKFQLQSQFQRFFNQTLCVFSHMKDIKHIRRDFHLAKTYQTGFSFGRLGHALGVGLRGTMGGLGGQNFFFPKFNQIWCVSYLHEWHMHRHQFLGSRPLGPWGGAKGQISLNYSQFQRFLNQTLCIVSQMKDI